jgi:surfactin synthase thioesterase subunit
MGGIHDADVTRENLEARRDQSSGAFHLLIFSGDHFFLHHQEKVVLEAIGE